MARTANTGWHDGPANDTEARTCTIWYVKRELGRSDFGDSRLCAYLQALIDQRGFPKPLPTFHRGQLTDEVRISSKWIRADVERWLHDFLPPATTAALDRAALEAAAADMDSAAAGLRLIQGGRA